MTLYHEGVIVPGSYLQPQNLIDEEILTLRQIYFGRKNYLQALPKGYETFLRIAPKSPCFCKIPRQYWDT